MSVRSTRVIDPQGRIVIPSNVRKALNIGTGNTVSLDMDDDGTIRIRAAVERCHVCGNSVEDKHHTDVRIGKGIKHICYDCAQSIARAMMR